MPGPNALPQYVAPWTLSNIFRDIQNPGQYRGRIFGGKYPFHPMVKYSASQHQQVHHNRSFLFSPFLQTVLKQVWVFKVSKTSGQRMAGS